jgi:diacylglycerol kinase family enzyme
MRYRCRRVSLGTDRVALVHGDGEELGHSPAEFEVVPGAVLVVA